MIPIFKPYIGSLERKLVDDAIKSGWISSVGKYVNMFEENFAEYINVKHALALSNGTSALHLSLVALGASEVNSILVPDITFIATANAVKYCGSRVIPVDIDPHTLCIDVDDIETKISNDTVGIVPVHLYGKPCLMNEIKSAADKYNLFVIEDAAEAHGAELLGKKIGSLGDIGTFSFYGNKIISTGEGGMITTDNSEIYDKIKILRDHAMSLEKRYYHPLLGYNYRMTNIQAAIGVAQLSKIEKIIDRKIEIYNIYKGYLKDIEGISINTSSNLERNVYWSIYTIINSVSEKERDGIIKEMHSVGIETRPFFYPISKQPLYATSGKMNSHRIAAQGINLPTYFEITEEQIKFVSNNFLQILSKNGYI